MTDPIQAHVDRVVIDSGKDIILTLVCSRRFRDECAAICGHQVVVTTDKIHPKEFFEASYTEDGLDEF